MRMPINPEPELFSAKTAPKPLLAAIEKLCADSGHTMGEMEQGTVGDAYSLAIDTYGDNLPEFWRIWGDWQHDDIQPMGDL